MTTTRVLMGGEDESRPQDGNEAWQTPAGLVRIAAPTEVETYYRLTWVYATGRRAQTTGGRVFA